MLVPFDPGADREAVISAPFLEVRLVAERFQLCADSACPILVADAITDEEIRHLQYPLIRNVSGTAEQV